MTGSGNTETVPAPPELQMPGVRELVVPRLPAERRRELLEWLARSALDLPPEAVAELRESWSDCRLYGPDLDEAWHRYLECLAVAEGKLDGLVDWLSIEDAAQQEADALAFLAG